MKLASGGVRSLPLGLGLTLLGIASCGGDSSDDERTQRLRGGSPQPGTRIATVDQKSAATVEGEAPAEDRVPLPSHSAFDRRAQDPPARQRAAITKCLRGYSPIASRRPVCEKTAIAVPSGATPGNHPRGASTRTETLGRNSRAGGAQEIVNDTFYLAGRYGDGVIHSNLGFYPIFYRYLVYPQDCVITLSADTGRCLIYIWSEFENSYSFGGIERAIYRRYFLATRIAPRLYRTRTVDIDFLDPYRYVCSDAPRTNTPRCTPNGPR